METGIGGLPAPPLEHVRWIDENGDERSPLILGELGHGYTILYFAASRLLASSPDGKPPQACSPFSSCPVFRQPAVVRDPEGTLVQGGREQ
jgi:hypothetical protein